MRVSRSQLVEGQSYYMDGSKKAIGVFVGKDEDTIYFDCGDDDQYHPRVSEPFKGKVPLWNDDSLLGFEQVENN